ncbi:MAG: DUF4870 domain-containing protein [Candidatus Nanoarchaeia archaeon]
MSKNENSKTCAILAYILLIGVIWYFVDEKLKKDAFVKFHVKQALFLAVVGIGIAIAVSIMSMVLVFIPFIGWAITGLLSLLGMIINLGLLILWIFGLINAINEKKEPIPIIGKFAEKIFTF